MPAVPAIPEPFDRQHSVPVRELGHAPNRTGTHRQSPIPSPGRRADVRADDAEVNRARIVRGEAERKKAVRLDREPVLVHLNAILFGGKKFACPPAPRPSSRRSRRPPPSRRRQRGRGLYRTSGRSHRSGAGFLFLPRTGENGETVLREELRDRLKPPGGDADHTCHPLTTPSHDRFNRGS